MSANPYAFIVPHCVRKIKSFLESLHFINNFSLRRSCPPRRGSAKGGGGLPLAFVWASPMGDSTSLLWRWYAERPEASPHGRWLAISLHSLHSLHSRIFCLAGVVRFLL